MQPFNRYSQNKKKETGFKKWFEAGRNVCANTMGIFKTADRENISIEYLARRPGGIKSTAGR